MRDDFDPKVLAHFSLRGQPRRYMYVKLRKPIIAMREARQLFSRPATGEVLPMRLRADNLLRQSSTYRDKGYCAVKGFLDDASHSALKQGWPARIFFRPGTSIFKSYDFGFKWVRGGRDPKGVGRFPAMVRLYELLRSEEMSRRVTELCGDGIPREAYSIAATWATSGSALIPHMDGIADRPGGDSFLNFIFFVHSNGEPADCGGTAIYEANNYDQALLRPPTMENALLAYRSDRPIYHGFEPIKRGKFRWAVLAQFASPSYQDDGSGH